MRLSNAIALAKSWKTPLLLEEMIHACIYMMKHIKQFKGTIITPSVLNQSAERFQEILRFKTEGVVPNPPPYLSDDEKICYDKNWREKADRSMSFEFETTADMMILTMNVPNVSAVAPNENFQEHSDEDMDMDLNV